jgi:hypothetical protein
MRILLAIAHYFRAEEGSNHSSTDAHRRDQRAQAVRNVIDAWRAHFGQVASLNVATRSFEKMIGPADQLEIVMIVNGDDHLLDSEFCRSRGVRIYDAKLKNPRKLGFSAHRLFANARHGYDMFVFSEDDLRPINSDIIFRILAFQDAFGYRRLLQPNRFELNVNGPEIKTYIDGMLNPAVVEPYEKPLPDERFLTLRDGPRNISFQRATNPHSGFFAITAEQLAYWMAQPHFNDEDCSFYTPLESSATLGMLKTFSIYKPFARSMGWLELWHLDNRFSGMDLPGARKVQRDPA